MHFNAIHQPFPGNSQFLKTWGGDSPATFILSDVFRITVEEVAVNLKCFILLIIF